MKENVGRIDRWGRFAVGPSLLALGVGPLVRHRECRPAALATAAAGLLLLESAITRVCPLLALLGLDSRSDAEKERDLRALDLEERARVPRGASGQIIHG